MKPSPTDQKLRGGYYTPKPIADFLARWAILSPKAEILEPSCGDGVILESALETLLSLGASKSSPPLLYGVEIDPVEAEAARQRLQSLDIPPAVAQIWQGDFFAYCKENLYGKKKFDVLIGNPPFIRYQNFPEEYRDLAFELMEEAGLRPNRLTNIWVPFLVISTLLLKKNGRLAMVIPAELFQVSYAAETREFVSNYYSRITLVTFKKLVFEGIQQEVVLFLGERNSTGNGGVRTIELEDLNDLESLQLADSSFDKLKPMDHSSEKWTQYFLDTKEILLLRTLRSHPKLYISGDLISVDVGVVTGQNQFFILTKEQVEEWVLEPYTRRIVSRSGHLEGGIFSEDDWTTNAERQVPAMLFCPPDVPFDQLPEPCKKYILYGEENEVNKGYKCSIRKRWYIVPSTWIPDAFMLRQIHSYPKLALNRSNATCTDTIHRVRFLLGANGNHIIAAFLNSLTFAFAEVTGRSYGGGVLTFEPSEAESLPLPLTGADKLDLDELDSLLRKDDIDAVLDITDEILLVKGLGLDIKEVRMLRAMWEKLRDRRINRK